MRRALVTGGSGFIGSHLTALLGGCGYEILNLDVKQPEQANPRARWMPVNILDRDELIRRTQEFAPSVLIHLAAYADVVSKDWAAFSSIWQGTNNVLDAVERTPEIKRLIKTSTQLVVGPAHTYEDDLTFAPYSRYGEAKADAERALRARPLAVEWTIVRPTNIWGPAHPSFPMSIWRYLAKRWYLHPETAAPIRRSYGYVGNTVAQYAALLEADSTATRGRVFYLGDDVIDSSLWLDGFSLELTGRRTRRVPAQILRAGGWIGDALRSTGVKTPLDSQRVMRMTTSYPTPLEPIVQLAGAPTVSLEEGVRRTVRWLRATYPEVYAQGRTSARERAAS